MVDVIIIGAGICGCAIAYELSRYDVNVMVIEKENDVSMGATKANSGIVHAGYDPPSGTLMAKYNVKGAALVKQLCCDLDVAYNQTGALVLAFDDDDINTLHELYERGIANGVREIFIISGEEVLKLEPSLNPNVKSALYAKTTAVVSPWELCLGLAQAACSGGIEFMLSTRVLDINTKQKHSQYFEVITDNGNFKSKFVINTSGVESANIASMVGEVDYCISPNKGEYFLLDHSQANKVSRVIFQCPNKNGKGVLVAPTAHNNLIVGPNAADCNAQDTATTSVGLAYVKESALRLVSEINFSENIRNFAGVRANSTANDFIVEISDKGFVNVCGIKSPGLTSAPAIAVDVVDMLKENGLVLNQNKRFCKVRKITRFKSLNDEEKVELIRKNPLYGRVICRCETVTEGEIVTAIHSHPRPCSIDGIKRRCGSGMGRCQGGFCLPKIHEILARELELPMVNVLMDKSGTFIISVNTKNSTGKETCNDA